MHCINLEKLTEWQKEIKYSGYDNTLWNGILINTLDREVLKKTHFTEVNTEDGIEYIDQEKTGYCWLAAALNCLGEYTKSKYEIDNIHFSKNYLVFYDKLEKANFFLQKMIDYIDIPVNDRRIRYLLRNSISDRGQWSMAENLIKKYGLIPYEIMDDSFSTHNSIEINSCLKIVLQYNTCILRKKRAEGKSIDILMNIKENMINEIYTFLIKCYGRPTNIISRIPIAYNAKEGFDKIKPLEFYNRYINFPFENYISISDLGSNEKFVEYRVQLDNNIEEGRKNIFLNLPSEIFYNAIVDQTKTDGYCWFSCDAGKFSVWNMNIYDDKMFDFSRIQSKNMFEELNKAELYDYGITSMTHAMMMKSFYNKWWIAKNSIKNNNSFTVHISDSWVKKYVFQAVVKKEDVFKVLDENEIQIRDIFPWDLFVI